MWKARSALVLSSFEKAAQGLRAQCPGSRQGRRQVSWGLLSHQIPGLPPTPLFWSLLWLPRAGSQHWGTVSAAPDWGGGAVPVLGENEGRGVPWLYVCSWGHLCCADPGSTEKHVEFRADAAGSCFLKKIEWHSFLSWCCFRGCRGRFSCYWSLQVVRRGHRPAAHCGWGAPAEPPFRLRRGLHAGAPGHPLPAAGHARHPAHGGEFSRDTLYGGNVFFCFFLLCVLFFFFFMWQCFSNSSYNVSLNSSEMFQILLSPLKSYIKLET